MQLFNLYIHSEASIGCDYVQKRNGWVLRWREGKEAVRREWEAKGLLDSSRRQRWGALHGWQDCKSPLGKREILCSTVYAHLTVCSYYFLNMSCSGPGRYLMTVSRMLSSSSSSSSPQPGGIAFFGRVRLPSALASSAAWASASFSSFFFIPYCRGEITHGQALTEWDD